MAENPQNTFSAKPAVGRIAKLREWTKRTWHSSIKPSALRILAIFGYVLFVGGASAGVVLGIVYIDKTYFQYIKHDGLSSGEFFAGIASIIGIGLLSWRGYLLYKQVNIQIQQVNIQVAKEIDDRFNAAIKLLASTETSARTGGIYSLYHIAMGYEKYRIISFQILCSHIRSKTQEAEYQKNYPDRPSNEIQTAIDLLFKRQNGQYGLYSTCYIPCYTSNHATLPGADLMYAYLVGADFQYANCYQVDFRDANCRQADFSCANCQQIDFRYANCQQAGFMGTDLHEARFEWCNCQQATFAGADCREARFEWGNCQQTSFQDACCQEARFMVAKCQKADFQDADCWRANFFNANCRQADFRGADCQGACFRRAKTDDTNFDGANINGAELDDGKKTTT